MKLAKFIERIGDWNPQLLRELNGKFTNTSVTVILVAAGLFQALAVLWLFSGKVAAERFYSEFHALNWLLPFVAILGGIYALIADLNREQKCGTFEFIRSSPQSGKSIFLGKLLGVPSLVYLAVLSFVPLHLCLAIAIGASLGLLLAWYVTIGVFGYFCAIVTSLYILYGGKRAILFAALTSQPIMSAIGVYDRYLISAIAKQSWMTTEPPAYTWFYLPISNNIWLADLFSCVTLLTIGNWLWIAIDRKYINSIGTVIEKQDSYKINAIVQVWLIGFALPYLNSTSADGNFSTLCIFQSLGAFSIVWMIPLILPSYHSLHEWMRSWLDKYPDLRQFNWRDPELIQELIWHDRSPAVLAVLINLAIAALGWGGLALGTFIVSHNLYLYGQFMQGLAISTLLTLIYTIVVQQMSFQAQIKNSGVMALFFLVSFVTLLLGLMFTTSWHSDSNYKEIGCIVLLFSPFFWIGIAQLSLPTIGLTMLSQLWILLKLVKTFKHQLLNVNTMKISSLSNQYRFDPEQAKF